MKYSVGRSLQTLHCIHWCLLTDFFLYTVIYHKHTGRGWLSFPTRPSSGWPCMAQGRNSKFCFQEIVSPDPQNIRAKRHRRQPCGLGALGFWKSWHRTDGQTDGHTTGFTIGTRKASRFDSKVTGRFENFESLRLPHLTSYHKQHSLFNDKFQSFRHYYWDLYWKFN